jgi:predicted DsbA family dithiol-disulfide isomerase
VPANSFNTHRLLHLAKDQGKQDAMKERQLKARFEEGGDVGDPETLVRLAAEADVTQTREFLAGNRFADEVRRDEGQAAEYGISGVPFFVFNRKYAVSGAQPVEVFEELLGKVGDEA